MQRIALTGWEYGGLISLPLELIEGVFDDGQTVVYTKDGNRYYPGESVEEVLQIMDKARTPTSELLYVITTADPVINRPLCTRTLSASEMARLGSENV